MARTLACALILFSAGSLAAQQFRVDTKVFLNGNKKPVSRSQTIFMDGRAYDFLESSREVAIVDLTSRTIKVLDVARKMKVEVTGNRMLQLISGIRARVLKKPNKIAVWLFNPKFQTGFDPIRREVSLIHKYMTYKAIGTPAKVNGADLEFQTFADAMARFSTLRNGIPPRPRMRLNLALRNKSFLPTNVQRTVAFGNGPKQTAKSLHKVRWMLDDQDKERVTKAENQWLSREFKQVPLVKFIRTNSRR